MIIDFHRYLRLRKQALQHSLQFFSGPSTTGTSF